MRSVSKHVTRGPRLALAVGLAAMLTGTPLHAQVDFETTEIADGVYQFRWIGHNGMFVTTDDGVVAIDPIGVDAASVFASEIRRIAPGAPLAAIVYSHSDADHSTGAAALMEAMGQEGVPIIAHQNALAPIRARASADQPMPNATFSDELRWQIGSRWIEFHYLGPSHTDNMVVPFIPDVGVAFSVDFVALDRMGYQDLPGWQFPEFFDAVSSLLDIPFQTMVFGHGPPGDRAAIQRQIAYYDDLTAAVRAAFAQGLTEDQAAQRVHLDQYADWDNYEDWFPLNVRAVYRWVAEDASTDPRFVPEATISDD
jgi:glyoxylase-like metal-dependent hydrolase (beta-lactamase superfamily II)